MPESRASVDSIFSIRDDPFFRTYQSPQSVRLAKEVAQSTKTAPLRQGTSFFDSEIPLPEDSDEVTGSSTRRGSVNGNREGSGSSVRSQQTRDHSTGSIRGQLPRLDVRGEPSRSPTVGSLEKTPTKAGSDWSPLNRPWGSSEVSNPCAYGKQPFIQPWKQRETKICPYRRFCIQPADD